MNKNSIQQPASPEPTPNLPKQFPKPPLTIGLFLILAIVGYFASAFYLNFWPFEPKTNTSIPNPNISLGPSINHAPKFQAPSAWKTYSNNLIGIEFKYPAEWGEPGTYPTKDITNLATVIDRYRGREGNTLSNSIYIRFSDDKAPTLQLFDNGYNGDTYPNAQTRNRGWYIDNIPKLKETDNICDYKINFDHRPSWSDTMEEIHNECSNGINTYLVKHTQYFTPILYSYGLTSVGYKKLQNGYFDNSLIRQSVANLSQTKNSNITFDQFLDKASMSLDIYKKNREIFTTFVQSIKAYKPTVPNIPPKEILSNEGQDIKIIRQYYLYITNGELQKAFDMYGAKRPTFETYQSWYKNTFFANPYEFKEVSPHRYQFYVDFQDHNEPVLRYNVVMEVSQGKITTISSEMLIGKEAIFGNMKAYVKQRQGRNYVILSQNGKETIVDAAGSEDIGAYQYYDLEFSRSGKYFTYRAVGWEWFNIEIYDIQNKKKLVSLPSAFLYEFAPDGTKLIVCAMSEMTGDRYAYIYSIPNITKEFDLFASVGNDKYFGLNCSYDKEKGIVQYTLSGVDNYEHKTIFNYLLKDKKLTGVK